MINSRSNVDQVPIAAKTQKTDHRKRVAEHQKLATGGANSLRTGTKAYDDLQKLITDRQKLVVEHQKLATGSGANNL